MKFVETPLAGAYVIELEPIHDERGFFARTWCSEKLMVHGLVAEIAQCSLSRNTRRGTLRGLHFQRPPHEETKIVHCVAGAIFDVIVDLRPQSPTHARWFGVELDAESGRALYVPKGFAHGFQTLQEETDVEYSISVPYAPEYADGVAWDDPQFGIEWPAATSRVISERDLSWPRYTPGS